ncbi:MAG: cation transporter, partial [Acetivibrio sp.]
MHANRKQQKKEKSALNISLYGGLIFVFLEFFMSIYTHSQAVLLDAIYDGVELVMILLSIGLVPFLYKPSNEKHPYGYLQVESLFVVIKGFMMISVTIGLIVNNMEIALKGGRNISFSSIAVFELFATILSIFIISSLRKRNRKINSPLVRME